MNDFTLVGGPTAVFEHASLRWMTDPAFSPPGDYDYLTPPAVADYSQAWKVGSIGAPASVRSPLVDDDVFAHRD